MKKGYEIMGTKKKQEKDTERQKKDSQTEINREKHRETESNIMYKIQRDDLENIVRYCI